MICREMGISFCFILCFISVFSHHIRAADTFTEDSPDLQKHSLSNYGYGEVGKKQQKHSSDTFEFESHDDPRLVIKEYKIQLAKCNKCEEHDRCEKKVAALGYVAARFIWCAVSNARPITMCTNCIDWYLNYQYVADDIVNIDESGEKCSDYYLNMDRADILNSVDQSVTNLWNKANCFNCFKSHGYTANHSVYEFSDEYIKFFQGYNETKECIKNATADFEGTHAANMTNSTASPCNPCCDAYDDLNRYFQTIEDKYDMAVCMDIIDSMNSTRHRWTDKYKCHLKRTEDVAVLTTGALVLLIPGIFYFALYMTSRAKDHKVIRQKRLGLSGSVSTPSTSQARY